MVHLDLFSGIGGFAYAADQVFGDVEHTFCDNEPFSQAVLRKHWPESYIYDDIRTITADTLRHERPARGGKGDKKGPPQERRRYPSVDLLTGGFPCQPFSAAGLRRGTADDRHLWPEMLRVIRLTEPEWVIAENVGGILTWNGGMVFEQVCADLEAAGYAVQPFVIPAVAVNAPHRRDRVWFVANRRHAGPPRRHKVTQGQQSGAGRQSWGQSPSQGGDAADTALEQRPGRLRHESRQKDIERTRAGWERNWSEVAAELCSVDDGLPAELDGLKLTKSQHRKEQLKAYGNAIVPQVAMEIMRGMA